MDAYLIYPKQFNNTGRQLQNNSCFVIMPFSDDLDNTYMVIDSVADDMGISCSRADNISTTSEPILNKICTQISQAYFIIVDITNLNPNVFYELGIAHVLRDAKKVLIIKEEGTECPSDIRHLHYYTYSKSTLKHLKTTIKTFFAENNALEDLLGILDFFNITPRGEEISHSFVADLSDSIGNNTTTILEVLNSRVKDTDPQQIYDLLINLTRTLNNLPLDSSFYPLYSKLTLLLIERTSCTFDISRYLSQIFSDKYQNLQNEWLADCGVITLDAPLYFDSVFAWMKSHLKSTSPAEFDIAKYKIEIGVIKSKSDRIDVALINELKSPNKTLVEHCVKLVKERKICEAIPSLVELVTEDENPYVVRSSVDALVGMAPIEILLRVKEILETRKLFVNSFSFIGKHLTALDQAIFNLQKTSDC